MANNIGHISKYAAGELDAKFAAMSKTAILEAGAGEVKFDATNAQTVYILDVAMDGLGNYSRSTGFPTGDITATWTPYTMTMDRGRSFSLDAMDDDEAGNMFGHVAVQFMKDHVVPEVDAYRLSKLLANATSANVTTGETISSNQVLKRLNADNKKLLDNEVDPTECIRFISTEVNQLIEDTTEVAKKVSVDTYTAANGIETRVKMYNETPMVVVPAKRFMSSYVFDASGFHATTSSDTAPTGGAATPAVAINFLTVHKNAAICVKKHQKVRVFTPDVNQTADAYKFDYRLYHDIFTPKNKQVGITASTK